MEYLQWKSVGHSVYGTAVVKQSVKDRPARNTTHFLLIVITNPSHRQHVAVFVCVRTNNRAPLPVMGRVE
jgi:hypothetical protein